MRTFLTLPILLFIAATAVAQQDDVTLLIEPIDRQYLRPGMDTLAILASHQGEMIEVGLAILETRIDDSTITRIEYLAIADNPPMRADSFLIDRKSLLPIASYKKGDYTRDLIFEGTSIRIVEAESTRTIPLTSKPFYASSMDLMLRSLPLETGYSATVPVFSELSLASMDVHITVKGKEMAGTRDGGKCEAFIVQVEGGSVEGTYRLNVKDRSLVGFEGKYAHLVRVRGCER
jgi:hypothetical protein